MCAQVHAVGSVLWLCWVVCHGVMEGSDGGWVSGVSHGRCAVDMGKSRAGDREAMKPCVHWRGVLESSAVECAVRGCCAVALWDVSWGGAVGVAVGMCHHLPPQGLGHQPLQSLTLTLPERSSGRRSGMRHAVLWEDWQNRPVFRRKFHEPQSCIIPHGEKH